MSDPKRATHLTVAASKSAKNKVNKTVRLTINLEESNESKYPELNYKELLIASANKESRQNGKTLELDENEETARKLEQKYGKHSSYGKKCGSKYDDYIDIGAGYDENDSFIDNTDGYDEMLPEESDTIYGGFYINCGMLEFKKVYDMNTIKRKKRQSSSSSSEDEKQTSEGEADNGGGDAESADSRLSQSDSLTSKPAPSSENVVTSDSSRDAETKVEVKLPEAVCKILDELETFCQQADNLKDEDKINQYITRLNAVLPTDGAGSSAGAGWARAARALRLPRDVLIQRAQARRDTTVTPPITSDIAQSTTANTTIPITTTTTTSTTTTPATTTSTTATTTTATSTTATSTNKRKADEAFDSMDVDSLTVEERDAKIEETLQRLKLLIEELEPGMIASYNAECERVQEEKKNALPTERATERRLPKRRFPWCARSRALLARLASLGGAPRRPERAAELLATRALPLFPAGFVRMPTLLRQANLNKDIKASDLKRPRIGSASQPATTNAQFTDQILFPSSLTVTTSVKAYEKPEDDKDKYKINPTAVYGTIMDSIGLSKDLVIESPDDRKKELERKNDSYIPPNSIGSITITAVPNQKEPLLKVKSPAALNEMVHKKVKEKKKPEKIIQREKTHNPLHIETNYQIKKGTPSPKTKEEISQEQIKNMRIAENNIPRPGLISVHHSPTFAKPDKRPAEVKKKKDVLIVSDVDPLADIHDAVTVAPQEPVAIDDSSSDVEVVTNDMDKIELKSDVKSVKVPSKDKVSDHKVNSLKQNYEKSVTYRDDPMDEPTDEDLNIVLRNIREMAHSQEPKNFNCNSHGGVITSAKRDVSSKNTYSRPDIYEQRSDRYKFAETTSLNRMDGQINVKSLWKYEEIMK